MNTEKMITELNAVVEKHKNDFVPTLILPIRKKWFDMILSGEKKEEYREIKPYYEVRFRNAWKGSLIGGNAQREIMFRNGYSKNSPSFIAKCTCSIGTGKEEWGAERDKQYFILTVNEIKNYNGGNSTK